MKPIRNQFLDLTKKGIWVEETQASALSRVPAAGRRFFTELFTQFPAIRSEMVFLRQAPSDRPFEYDASEYVNAIFDRFGNGFAVSIDGSTECITIWNETTRAEHADWGGTGIDPAESAMTHVREILRPKSGIALPDTGP